LVGRSGAAEGHFGAASDVAGSLEHQQRLLHRVGDGVLVVFVDGSRDAAVPDGWLPLPRNSERRVG
jgi:hypothetical protein